MIARINKLTSYNYDSTLKDSIVELNKRTTKVTYILYSPNFDYFIAILTYEVSNEPAEKYGHITLLGQKINSKIYSYAFTGTMQGGYGTSPSRNGAVYRGLSDVFYYWGIDPGDNNLYGFGRVLLKLKPSENPPSVDFWVSNGVKNLFQFKTDTTINIKYKSNINTKDSASVDWPIWVYTN
jgi:hypothetical protein